MTDAQRALMALVKLCGHQEVPVLEKAFTAYPFGKESFRSQKFLAPGIRGSLSNEHYYWLEVTPGAWRRFKGDWHELTS